ncbi:MAG TPA: murein L,D-transpeptidase [Ignavibacteria bacterium]|nr:murein L,D-transpeptidase [Ignavibacteria bacterium]
MKNIGSQLPKIKFKRISSYLNPNLIRNILFFSGGIILFILGCILYGVILNLREIPLSKAMKLKGFTKLDNVNIVINRKTYSLNLYQDTVFIKSYRANFGMNINNPKTRQGDNATPVGNYKICEIDTAVKYYKFFKLNYPNLEDATEGLRKGIITQAQFDKLKFEYYYGNCPNDNTALGGNIGIQGIGKWDFIFKYLPFVYNWTNGSIALSNEDMDELYSVVKEGTKVVIK